MLEKLWVHDHSIVEGSTDSIEAVIGHNSQQDTLRGAQPQSNIQLDHTASVANGLVRPLEIPNICGTILVVKQRSRKERLERKKYMGVWSLGLKYESSMIAVFPISVRMYMIETTRRRSISRWGWSEKPSRMKPAGVLAFAPLIA